MCVTLCNYFVIVSHSRIVFMFTQWVASEPTSYYPDSFKLKDSAHDDVDGIDVHGEHLLGCVLVLVTLAAIELLMQEVGRQRARNIAPRVPPSPPQPRIPSHLTRL